MKICRAEFKTDTGSVFEVVLTAETPARGIVAYFIEVCNARTKNRLLAKTTYDEERALSIWREECLRMAESVEAIRCQRLDKSEEKDAINTTFCSRL